MNSSEPPSYQIPQDSGVRDITKTAEEMELGLQFSMLIDQAKPQIYLTEEVKNKQE